MYDLIPGSVLSEEERVAAKAREDAACLRAIGKDRKQDLQAYSLLLQLWSHDINLLRSAFGEPQQIRYAEIRVGTPPPPQPPPLQVLAVLDFGPEVACMWESRAFMVNEAWDEELALFGTERTVRVSFPFMYLKNTPSMVRVEESVGGEQVRKDIVSGYDEAYKRELRHFYDCVVNDTEPITHGGDARKDLELAIGIINKAAQSSG
jgi:predicted dehydrogenase